jgi:hypothetical protein
LPGRSGYCRHSTLVRAALLLEAGIGLLCLGLSSCGSAPEPPAADASDQAERPEAKVSDQEPTQVAAAKKTIPWRCRKSKPPCMPPPTFVERLCQDVYPDVALHMFAPGTPWRRFYMLHTAEPFNASGGASLLGDKMRRGEEVIALRRRNAKNGIQVSDISGWDVLRWNGACASIHDGEFTTDPPNSIGNARPTWRSLGPELRQSLEENPELQEVYEARRKSCKGISIGRVSADCEEFDKKLSDEIVRVVRNGTKLPKPAKVP